MCKRFFNTHIKNINEKTDIKVELESNKKTKTFLFKIKKIKDEKTNKELSKQKYQENNIDQKYNDLSKKDQEMVDRLLMIKNNTQGTK
jgi:hypothetical protein